jgi:calcineurin-like phosphoesterase family protein
VRNPIDYYTADEHFCHPFVAQLRGYATADDHDRALIDRWNDLVNPWDRVTVVGDLGCGPEAAILERAGELNGLHDLYAGNHDLVHPMHKRYNKPSRQAAWRALFPGGVHLFGRRNVAGRHVMISHLPYEGDHTPADRYQEWRPQDRGAWLICGHVHAEWKQAGRQVNVGLDVWDQEPVPLGRLTRFIMRSDVAAAGHGRDRPAAQVQVALGDDGGADEPGAGNVERDDPAVPVEVDVDLRV